MPLSEKQRGVARGALPALLTSVLALTLAALLLPAPAIPDEPGARLAFALRCDLFVLVWVLFGVGALGRLRFRSPADIDGSGLTTGTDEARVLSAVLQNTLEQTVLAVGGHLVLASVAPLEHLMIIPVAVGLFCLGRVLFWRGYAKGAPGRAAGFALTFYPTALIYAYSVIATVITLIM